MRVGEKEERESMFALACKNLHVKLNVAFNEKITSAKHYIDAFKRMLAEPPAPPARILSIAGSRI